MTNPKEVQSLPSFTHSLHQSTYASVLRNHKTCPRDMNCNSNSSRHGSLSYQRFGLFVIGQVLHSTTGTVHLYSTVRAPSPLTPRKVETIRRTINTRTRSPFHGQPPHCLTNQTWCSPHNPICDVPYPPHRLMTYVPHSKSLSTISAKTSSVG